MKIFNWLFRQNKRQVVSEVVHQFALALRHADFDKIQELCVPELQDAASADTINVHLVSIPKHLKVIFKDKERAIVTGKFELQVSAIGRTDIVRTTAKFLLTCNAGKWLLDDYSWRDYLLEE